MQHVWLGRRATLNRRKICRQTRDFTDEAFVYSSDIQNSLSSCIMFKKYLLYFVIYVSHENFFWKSLKEIFQQVFYHRYPDRYKHMASWFGVYCLVVYETKHSRRLVALVSVSIVLCYVYFNIKIFIAIFLFFLLTKNYF